MSKCRGNKSESKRGKKTIYRDNIMKDDKDKKMLYFCRFVIAYKTKKKMKKKKKLKNEKCIKTMRNFNIIFLFFLRNKSDGFSNGKREAESGKSTSEKKPNE